MRRIVNLVPVTVLLILVVIVNVWSCKTTGDKTNLSASKSAALAYSTYDFIAKGVRYLSVPEKTHRWRIRFSSEMINPVGSDFQTICSSPSYLADYVQLNILWRAGAFSTSAVIPTIVWSMALGDSNELLAVYRYDLTQSIQQEVFLEGFFEHYAGSYPAVCLTEMAEVATPIAIPSPSPVPSPMIPGGVDSCTIYPSVESCVAFDGGNGPYVRGCRWSSLSKLCYDNRNLECSAYTQHGVEACVEFDNNNGPYSRGCRWDSPTQQCYRQ